MAAPASSGQNPTGGADPDVSSASGFVKYELDQRAAQLAVDAIDRVSDLYWHAVQMQMQGGIQGPAYAAAINMQMQSGAAAAAQGFGASAMAYGLGTTLLGNPTGLPLAAAGFAAQALGGLYADYAQTHARQLEIISQQQVTSAGLAYSMGGSAADYMHRFGQADPRDTNPAAVLSSMQAYQMSAFQRAGVISPDSWSDLIRQTQGPLSPFGNPALAAQTAGTLGQMQATYFPQYAGADPVQLFHPGYAQTPPPAKPHPEYGFPSEWNLRAFATGETWQTPEFRRKKAKYETDYAQWKADNKYIDPEAAAVGAAVGGSAEVSAMQSGGLISPEQAADFYTQLRPIAGTQMSGAATGAVAMTWGSYADIMRTDAGAYRNAAHSRGIDLWKDPSRGYEPIAGALHQEQSAITATIVAKRQELDATTTMVAGVTDPTVRMAATAQIEKLRSELAGLEASAAGVGREAAQGQYGYTMGLGGVQASASTSQATWATLYGGPGSTYAARQTAIGGMETQIGATEKLLQSGAVSPGTAEYQQAIQRLTDLYTAHGEAVERSTRDFYAMSTAVAATAAAASMSRLGAQEAVGGGLARTGAAGADAAANARTTAAAAQQEASNIASSIMARGGSWDDVQQNQGYQDASQRAAQAEQQMYDVGNRLAGEPVSAETRNAQLLYGSAARILANFPGSRGSIWQALSGTIQASQAAINEVSERRQYLMGTQGYVTPEQDLLMNQQMTAARETGASAFGQMEYGWQARIMSETVNMPGSFAMVAPNLSWRAAVGAGVTNPVMGSRTDMHGALAGLAQGSLVGAMGSAEGYSSTAMAAAAGGPRMFAPSALGGLSDGASLDVWFHDYDENGSPRTRRGTGRLNPGPNQGNDAGTGEYQNKAGTRARSQGG